MDEKQADVRLHSLPLFFRGGELPVLVTGGERSALRRIRRLLAAGARVTVVAPDVFDSVRQYAESGRLEWRPREFQDDDVIGQRLVIAASATTAINSRVAAAARAADIPVHRVDAPAESDFFVPALVNRAPLLIALSSGGAAPTLTRRLHAELETRIPAAYGRLAALAGRFRQRVAEALPPHRRAAFWASIFDGPIAEKVFGGRDDEAEADLVKALLWQVQRSPTANDLDATVGEVYLVGAGPGDPDLLTFRALRLMQRADVVLYDSLVNPAIVDLVHRDAERIHVGKRASRHTLPQGDINQYLVRLAREGKRVLRLKGGDPFIFGRGGEEIEQLADEGIPFQVVPGITSPGGCAAYAGIPLTHRDYSQAVIFATGHRKDGRLDLDWPMLARPNQTAVFFMSRETLPEICRKLTEHGLPGHWPAALVISGTTPEQRVIVSDLSGLAGRAAVVEDDGPGLLIVGEVVSLNEKLGWFRHREDDKTSPASAA